MKRQKIDFSYEISDERLLAYAQVPLLDRLRWLDEIRQFTLMLREAPETTPGITETHSADSVPHGEN